jgi:AcrR family transcriptional regulator
MNIHHSESIFNNLNKPSSMEKAKRKIKEYNFRRSEIILEAEKVFAAKGFFNSTVADIAQASGYAVGTLYQFFQSKEELYMTMVAEKMDLMYSGMRSAVEQKEGPVEKLRILILSYFQFVENNLDFCNLFFRGDTASLSDGSKSLRNRMFEEHIKQARFIEDIISEGIDKEVLMAVDAHTISFTLSGMIRGVIFDWMMTIRDKPLTNKTSLVLDIFLHGVLKDKQDEEMKGTNT